MQRWEYCAVTGVGTGLGVTATVTLFTAQGARTNKIEKGPDATASTIAQLGLQGWELVGTGVQGVALHALYFKRPLP